MTASFADAQVLAGRMLSCLFGESVRPTPVHPALTRLVRALPELLDADVRTAALASKVRLSEGRLSHLFGAEVGIPLRPYVLWLRMQRAMDALESGASLTAAAYSGGFTDAPHLTRVFRRMFGITPSEVRGFAEW